jgi:hypothetical protein
MKRLISILFLALSILPTFAVDRITATLTLTNTPSAGNTFTVNGDARTWAASVTTPATEILIGASIGASKTNQYLQIAATPYAGGLALGQSGTNVITLTAQPGGALAASLTGAWGSIAYSTQTVSTAWTVRVPMTSAEPTLTQRTNIASLLSTDLSTFSTNPIAAAAVVMENFVNRSTAQTVSGAKVFDSLVTFTNDTQFYWENIVHSNAVFVFNPGAYLVFKTNVWIEDAVGAHLWAFDSTSPTNGIVTFIDVTNRVTSLKAADNSWTGTNTFTQITNSVVTDSTITDASSTGTLTVGSDLSLTRVNNTSLANGNNAGVDFGSAAVFVKVKAGPTGAFTINGLAGGRNGRVLKLYNATGQNMTIAHDSGVDPTPANRIYTMTGADRATTANGTAELVYDSEDSRWILISLDQ